MSPVVSDTNTSAADPLSPASCEVGSQWIRSVGPEYPIDASLETKATP